MISPAVSSDRVAVSRVILRDVLISAVVGLVAGGVTWLGVRGQQSVWMFMLLPLVLLAVRVILRARVSARFWPVELCALSQSVGYWCGFYLPLLLHMLLIERHYVALDGFIAVLLIATAVVLGALGFLVWRVEDRVRRNRRNHTTFDPV